MNKTKMLSFLILLVCTILAATAHASNGMMQLAQISDANVAQLTYLRTQPDDSADITFGYNKGVYLMILDENANGWCYVSLGNQQGYVKKTELSTKDVTTSSSATLGVALVTPESRTGWVNLREFPSMEAEVLSKLRDGKEALVLGIADGWNHVMVDDEIGYIRDEFLRYSGYDRKITSMDLKVPLVVTETKRPAKVISSRKPTAQPNRSTAQSPKPNPVITSPPGLSQATLKDSFSQRSSRGYNVFAEFKATGNGQYQIYIRVNAPADYVETEEIKSFNAYINGSKATVPLQRRDNLTNGGFEAIYSTTTSFEGFVDTVNIAPVSSAGELSGEDMFFSNLLSN